MAGTTLLDAIDADADGIAICDCKKNLVAYAYATTWGGGTVTFQTSPDGGTTWFSCVNRFDGSAAAFAANGTLELQAIGEGALIRAILSGATNPVDVTAQILNN